MRGLRALALAAACLAGAVAAGDAQDVIQVPSPILTLDQERLFEGSRAAARISAEIERRTNELTAENRRIEAELTEEELALTERRAALTPAEFRDLADAFHEKVQGIRAAQDAKARELQRMQEEERQSFLRQITPVLAEIVRERGAVLVVDRRSVILSAESIDITDEAIERINEVFELPDAPEPGPGERPEPPAPGSPAPIPMPGPAPAPDPEPEVPDTPAVPAE